MGSLFMCLENNTGMRRKSLQAASAFGNDGVKHDAILPPPIEWPLCE